jgi:hypothetical protein
MHEAMSPCHLVPSQIITYLGAVFNLNKGLVLPSENRFLAINQAIADIIYNPVHKTSDTSCEVETWEFVGMHLTDLRWTPTPPHGGLE